MIQQIHKCLSTKIVINAMFSFFILLRKPLTNITLKAHKTLQRNIPISAKLFMKF